MYAGRLRCRLKTRRGICPENTGAFHLIGTVGKKNWAVFSESPDTERNMNLGIPWKSSRSPFFLSGKGGDASRAKIDKIRSYSEPSLRPTKDKARLEAKAILEYGYVKQVFLNGIISIKYNVRLKSEELLGRFEELILQAMKRGLLSTQVNSNIQIASFVELRDVGELLEITKIAPINFNPFQLNDNHYVTSVARAILDGGFSTLRICDGERIRSRYEVSLAPGADMSALRQMVLIALIKNQFPSPVISNEETMSFVEKAVRAGVLVTNLVERRFSSSDKI